MTARHDAKAENFRHAPVKKEEKRSHVLGTAETKKEKTGGCKKMKEEMNFETNKKRETAKALGGEEMKKEQNFEGLSITTDGAKRNFQPNELQSRLFGMNLRCRQTDTGELEKSKEEVSRLLPEGKCRVVLGSRTLEADGKRDLRAADTQWKMAGAKAAAYRNQLGVLLSEKYFRLLMEKSPEFKNRVGKQEEFEESCTNATTAAIIKNMFAKLLGKASTAFPQGICVQDLESLASWLMPENISDNTSNYKGENSALLEVVLPKDGSTEVEGIGAIELKYELSIESHSDKKKTTHNNHLKLRIRSVFYTEQEQMDRDWKIVTDSEKNSMLERSFPLEKKAAVFDLWPGLTLDNLIRGVSLHITEQELRTLVLYEPEFIEVASLDNKNSSAETGFDVSVTEGFSSTEGIAFEEGVTMEAGCEFAKAGISISTTLSVSSETSKTTTNTLRFTVGAGQSATIYQVRVKYGVMKLNRVTGEITMEKKAENVFSTNRYVTV